MTIDIGAIELWHRRASAQRKPSFSLALGCFLEEVSEGGEAIDGGRWLSAILSKMDDEAHHLKRGSEGLRSSYALRPHGPTSRKQRTVAAATAPDPYLCSIQQGRPAQAHGQR